MNSWWSCMVLYREVMLFGKVVGCDWMCCLVIEWILVLIKCCCFFLLYSEVLYWMWWMRWILCGWFGWLFYFGSWWRVRCWVCFFVILYLCGCLFLVGWIRCLIRWMLVCWELFVVCCLVSLLSCGVLMYFVLVLNGKSLIGWCCECVVVLCWCIVCR